MSDVFTIDTPTSVSLSINGTDKGSVPTGGKTLGTFVREQAQIAGVRAFSVYLNGQKMDTANAGDALPDGAELELVAKDARG